MKSFGITIGSHDEIEAELKNAYESPARSPRRQVETLEVSRRFIRGEAVFWWGSQLYIVGDPDVTPQAIGSILMGYLS